MTTRGSAGSIADILAWTIYLLALALLLSAPFWAKQGLLFLIGVAVIQGAFALTWNLLYGGLGIVSFGHAAFYAIGAYTAAVALKYDLGVSYLGAMLLSFLMGAIVAVLVGVLVLRRSSGIYLAILTLALSELLYQGIMRIPLLGNEDGLAALQRPTLDLFFLRINLRAGFDMYYFLLVVAAAIAAIIWRLTHSRFGRVLRAIRQDPERVEFLGINVFYCRLAAFAISGGLAALVGTLHTPWVQLVTPDVGNWTTSTQPLLNTLVGGASSFWGPVVGAFVFSGINLMTQNLTGLSELTMGAMLLVIVLLAPNGLVGVWRALSLRVTGGMRRGPHVAD
jgi:branched-chain amino acid transport system permease protein